MDNKVKIRAIESWLDLPKDKIEKMCLLDLTNEFSCTLCKEDFKPDNLPFLVNCPCQEIGLDKVKERAKEILAELKREEEDACG